jgi:hypothetical protein
LEHSIEEGRSSRKTENPQWIETTEPKQQKSNPSDSDSDEMFIDFQQLNGRGMVAGSSTDAMISPQDMCLDDVLFNMTELPNFPEDQLLLTDDNLFTDNTPCKEMGALAAVAYSLSNIEREVLLSIAMPKGLVLGVTKGLSTETDKEAVSPIGQPCQPSLANKKRKSIANDAIKQSKSQSQTSKENTLDSKRSGHCAIEKKYRDNLKDKFMQLRRCVPSLCPVASSSAIHTDVVSHEEYDETDLDGLETTHKFDKATIIVKTIEYIKHLEKHQQARVIIEGTSVTDLI